MKLAVVVGSTRPNRQTLKEVKWVAAQASLIEGIEAETVDLKDYPMPFFNEPLSPRANPNREIDPQVKKWLDKISSFDAYVFVTAEYNHSIPAVLKNAIDYLTTEITRKPSAVAGHGTVGGARAMMHLKEILSESRSVVIPQQVAFIGLSEGLDDDGNLSQTLKDNPYNPEVALKAMLEELKWYSDALSRARNS
jgi:NAD(P)H-dependent FMN reductase